MSGYNFPVEVRYTEPKLGAVVRTVGRDLKYRGGSKKGRKAASPRKDPALCLAQLHPWIPENIIPGDLNVGKGDGCRICVVDRSRRNKQAVRAADPVKVPVRQVGAKVALQYTELRELGYSFAEIAIKLQMKQDALTKSLFRSGTPR